MYQGTRHVCFFNKPTVCEIEVFADTRVSKPRVTLLSRAIRMIRIFSQNHPGYLPLVGDNKMCAV